MACVGPPPTHFNGIKLTIPKTQIGEVSELPQTVKDRWTGWTETWLATPALERSELYRECAALRSPRQQEHFIKLPASVATLPRGEAASRQRLEGLQARLMAAERKRHLRVLSLLERGVQRAQRSHRVATRLAERQNGDAQKLFEGLRAAEGRRYERLQAQKERLNAAHTAAMRRLGALRAVERTGVRGLLSVQLSNGLEQQMEDGETDQDRAFAARHEQFKRQVSIRKVQQHWKAFCNSKQTTVKLVERFVATGVTDVVAPSRESRAPPTPGSQRNSPASPPASTGITMIGGMSNSTSPPRHALHFEDFAVKLQAPATLSAAQALLGRLEVRLSARGVASESARALLRRLFPRTPASSPMPRYPVRVFLCAYMVLRHPEIVFNGAGDVETKLASAAHDMIAAFEVLLKRVLEPPPPTAGSTAGWDSRPATAGICPSPLSASMKRYRQQQAAGARENQSGSPSIARLLLNFDQAWLEYLDQFVVWKRHDSASLVTELVRMAVKLERSMLLKVGLDEGGRRLRNNGDLQAMKAQVAHDHELLRDRIQRLSGAAGVAQLEEALLEARAEVASDLEEAASVSSDSWESSAGRSSRSSSRAPSRESSFNGMSGPAPGGADARRPTARKLDLDTHNAVAALEMERQQPEPVGKAAAPAAGDKFANEQLIWEFLYNPQNKLPTAEAEAAWERAKRGGVDEAEQTDPSELSAMEPEQLLAALQRRTRLIAERAFWDSVEHMIARGAAASASAAGSCALAEGLANLISGLGTDLVPLAEDVAQLQYLQERYSKDNVVRELTPAAAAAAAAAAPADRAANSGGPVGVRVQVLAGMLEEIATALLRAGSPERRTDATQATQQMKQQLAVALQADQTGPGSSFAPVLTKALRLLHAQLKLVKLDAANARLQQLARGMQEEGAAAYLRTKFAAAYKLPTTGDVANDQADVGVAARSVLPKTATWLRDTMEALPLLQRSLQAAGLTMAAATADDVAALQQQQFPVEMRTGRRSTLPQVDTAAATAVKPIYPVALDSWRGVLRAGLLCLVAADTPAAGPELPEVLQFDRERLHAAQNGFQRLMVMTAGLLIVQQTRKANGVGWTAEDRDTARRRLMVVVADGGMRLNDLVTELALLAGAGGRLEAEEAIKKQFMAVVNPTGQAYAMIRTSLSTALLSHLLHGRDALAADAEATRALGALLAKTGAAAIADNLASVAEELAGISAVNEAVHDAWLMPMIAPAAL